MQVFRAVIHGHVIELRRGDWGGELVLVDGRPVSERPLAGWWRGCSHFFPIEDEQGAPRLVEVRLMDISSIGLGRYRCVVSVNGVERCRLEPLDPKAPPDVCANCGYALQGLPLDNGEIRCPECGRHTTAMQ